MTNPENIKNEILDKVSEYYLATHAKNGPNNSPNLPFAGRIFDDTEIRALVSASLDFWLTHGVNIDVFEEKLAKAVDAKHCLFVNSGSSANLLAFAALTSHMLKERQIRPGDEVITTACCFPTTISPIIQLGAIPVFIDISPKTGNLDPQLLEKALTKKTKAVMVAHTLGNPFHVSKIKQFCDENKLWLIEDNCDALGAKWQNHPTGTFGDIGTSSFYPAHHITTGEGGAVYTNNKLLNKIMRSLRDWGRDCWCAPGKDNTCGARFSQKHGTLPCGYDHKYIYSHLGFNLKGTDLQGAIGRIQIDKLPGFINSRNSNWESLHNIIGQLPQLATIAPYQEASPSWFGYFMLVKECTPFARNDLVKHLEAKGIQTRNLFSGNILKHPCFTTLDSPKNYRVASPLKHTNHTMNNGFWVGVYPGLTEDNMIFIGNTIKEFINKRGKQNV